LYRIELFIAIPAFILPLINVHYHLFELALEDGMRIASEVERHWDRLFCHTMPLGLFVLVFDSAGLFGNFGCLLGRIARGVLLIGIPISVVGITCFLG